MKFGIMMRGQFPPDDDARARFEDLMQQARVAQKLGFASLTKGSHYSTTPFLQFQQLPFLARLAAEAPDMRLIAGIVLLALHKPLDIAEQLATIDVISNGKLVFGAGIGYRDVEFKAFGLTKEEAVLRFEENIAAIKRLWAEDSVDMVASHFELDGARCPVKPIQQPRPPIWFGANADAAVRRTARLADTWYINPHVRLDTVERQLEVYKRALDEAGKPFPDELPIIREVFVGPTHDEALALCRPALETKYKAYHQWGQDKVMPKGDDDLDLDFDELTRDRFLLGSPDEVTEQILDMVRRTGANHLVMGIQFPGMSQQVVLDSMQLLSEEVFPRVREGL